MIGMDAVGVRAGSFHLRDVTAEVPRGKWAVALGPPGSGKTTLLETVAGVRRVESGRVLLRGTDVTHVPPEQRGLAIVHQRGYLFPHLSVQDNILYGARDAGYARSLTKRFGADALVNRPVRTLSGGEGQVVALVRALATRPDILLLDEPFAALDPRGRTQLRLELQGLQREQDMTVLQVTHDFAEAGLLGDLALLLDAGRLVQSGTPEDVFRRPASVLAAGFLGVENVIAGVAKKVPGHETLRRFDAGPVILTARAECAEGPGHAVIRGEDIMVARNGAPVRDDRSVMHGTVVELIRMGLLARVTIDVHGMPLVATLTSDLADTLGLERGLSVQATVDPEAVHLC